MKVLLVTAGSGGDVNPFLAVGLELRRRGHDVALLVNPYFERRTRESGIEYLPFAERDLFVRLLRDRRIMHPLHGPRLVFQQLLEQLPRGLRIVEHALDATRPDIVVRHPLCYGTRWLCERRRVACAPAMLAPSSWLSLDDWSASRSPVVRRLKKLLLRAVVPLALLPLRHLVERPTRRVARDLGFPAEPDLLLRELRAGVVNLGLWSPVFREAQPDDPPNGLICGFPWYDETHDAEETEVPELEAFLGDDPDSAPIVFTLGTAAVYSAGDFYHRAVEACRHLGRRGLLLVGATDASPPAADGLVRVIRYAKYSTLLPRAAATVHHGGIGTVGQALRSGRPMLVIPRAFDQHDNAAHVKRLGTGGVIWRRRPTARGLARALDRLLHDPAVGRRAAEVGAAIRREDGARVAADALERAAVGREATGAGAQPPGPRWIGGGGGAS